MTFISTDDRSRRRRPLLLGALAVGLVFFGAVPVASAAIAITVVPSVPQNVTVGSTVGASLQVTNLSTDEGSATYSLDSFRVDDVTVVLSCATQAAAADCPLGSRDSGALVPSPLTATGRAGTACAGQSFAIADIDPTQGRYRFTASPQVVLGSSQGSPAAASCTIDFAVNVARVPAIDADPATAGPQTAQLAFAAVTDTGTNAGQPGSAVGTSRTTVARAAPSIATSASADITLGTDTLTDSATVGGRVNPVDGAPIIFRLFGPDDATCSATPLFESSVPYPSSGGAVTSGAFTPTQVGTYRWTASYSGDANNLPVAGACGDAGESVTVASPPPQVAELGPRILSAEFQPSPRVGTRTFLVVRAVDPMQPISGLRVRFGEPRGLSGISACRVPALGLSLEATTLRLPYAFTRPGRHLVKIEVLSGDCTGVLRRTVTTIEVNVAAAASARQAYGAARRALASGDLIAGAAKTKAKKACKGAFVTATSANRAQIAAAVLCLVNVERNMRGRKKLLRSRRLELASGAHSGDMFKRRYFEHERVPGGPTLIARLKKAGYRGRTYAENIGYGTNFAATLIVRAWMNSPPHRANILQPRLKFAGVGTAIGIPSAPEHPGTTYTMDFGATAR